MKAWPQAGLIAGGPLDGNQGNGLMQESGTAKGVPQDLGAGLFLVAVSLIASFPALGKRYRGAAVAGLRRYLLRSTRFHIYYVHTKTQVTILTIWGAVRGTTPDVQRLLDEFRSRKA